MGIRILVTRTSQYHNIEVTPTLIFYDKEKKELSRSTGPLSEEHILKKWKELIEISPAVE